jgi:hypothetical protein
VDVKSVGIDAAAPVRVEFDLPLDDARRERSRWYSEEYLQYPLDPAPAMAAAIVERLKDFGGLLFRNIFDHTKEGRRLWAAFEGRIGQARSRVACGRGPIGGVAMGTDAGSEDGLASGDRGAGICAVHRRKIDRRGDQRRDGAGASGDFAALRGTGCAVSGGGGTAVGLAQ